MNTEPEDVNEPDPEIEEEDHREWTEETEEEQRYIEEATDYWSDIIWEMRSH